LKHLKTKIRVQRHALTFHTLSHAVLSTQVALSLLRRVGMHCQWHIGLQRNMTHFSNSFQWAAKSSPEARLAPHCDILLFTWVSRSRPSAYRLRANCFPFRARL